MSHLRTLRSVALLLGLALGGCVGSDDARAQGPDALLRQGEYDQAIELMEGELGESPSAESAVELARVLIDVGRLDEAEDLLREWQDDEPASSRVSLELAGLLHDTGRLDEAAAIVDELRAQGSRGDALVAELYRGEILLERGEREAALEIFDGFIDVYNSTPSLNSRELHAVARAVQHLGVTDSGLYRDALRAFDEAIAADPDNLAAHVGVGMLFLQTYNIPDARASFQEALDRRAGHPPALLGMALAAQLEGSPEAAELAEQALEVNPDLPGARILRARIRLAGEDMDGAEEDLEAALEVDPTSSEALGVLAAARYLTGRTEEFEALRNRAMEANPRDAEFFVTLADLVSTRRFYAEAIDFAARGVELDSLAWEAYGQQGLNQLRTGDMTGGRQNLEQAFAGDPFNLWIKNTLDLLDLMDTFEDHSSDRIQVLVDPEDGAALATYMLEVGEQAYEALSERYGYEPVTPIRIEAFRRSADFSVRTVGMAGLGALGVAFGTVVAMDSPAARGTEGFHWASTLWHEMAHVVHLGITDHHMPRWLSEGLAVHEERVAGEDSGWGYRPSLPFFAAYLSDRLRTPSELSLSFVRPRAPEEVGFAYILGSLVSRWIEDEWGFEAILDMMEGYRERLTPDRVLERALGVGPAEFDRRFDEWFTTRYAHAIEAAEATMEGRGEALENRSDPGWLETRVEEAPLDVGSRMALAQHLIEQERLDDAEAHLVAARDAFRENPDPNGPNRLLAAIYLERGDDEAALEALEDHLSNVADDYRANVQLADLREERGDTAGAARALEGAIRVYPFEAEVHQRLASLYAQLDAPDQEVREREVVLALDPVDRTGALYELADALHRAGMTQEARRRVLQALELAPRYPEAQELLLRIMEEESADP